MSESKTEMLRDKVNDWDIAGCLYLNAYCHRQAIQRFFAVISRLGDGTFWYGLVLALPLLDDGRGLLVAGKMLLAGGVCALLYKKLKSALVRERPFIRSDKILQGCAPLDRYSFPSGHTMHAVCFSTVVLWYYPVLAWILLPFTLLIALSRMVLGLHYPTDVICGAVLGFLLGALALVLLPPAW